MTERGIEVPVLTGERIRLRPLQPSDRAERVSIGRDPEFVRLNGGNGAVAGRPFTDADADRWFAARRASLRWAIELDSQLIGETRLDSLDAEDRSAMFAIGIYHPRWWDQGYGTEAARLVLAHGFAGLALHRIALRVLLFNQRAIASYRRLGFVEEGRERESALVDGEWQDDLRMSLLDREWRELELARHSSAVGD